VRDRVAPNPAAARPVTAGWDPRCPSDAPVSQPLCACAVPNRHEGLTLGFALGAHARPPCLPAHHPALRLAGAARPERRRLKSNNLTHPQPFRWRLRGRTTGSTRQRSGRSCATPGPASVKAQATSARPWRSSVSTRRRRLGRRDRRAPGRAGPSTAGLVRASRPAAAARHGTADELCRWEIGTDRDNRPKQPARYCRRATDPSRHWSL
jgi:hypothetical protein